MISIGASEFRRHTGKYIRLAKAVEVVEITERGEPIARIEPHPELVRRQRLATEETRSRDS